MNHRLGLGDHQTSTLPPVEGLTDSMIDFYVSNSMARPSMTGRAPDILSASTYPTETRQPRRNTKRKESQQFYGGFVLRDAEEASKAPSGYIDENPPPTKRAKRSSKSDEDDSKKQRGRPRLDTQDETAADRRRTQIRLAQRAYRHRKETTISALKKRVNELEGTIEQMNKSFLEFHDNAIDSGALLSRPALMKQLKDTTEEFVQLAKIASIDSDHEEEAAIIAEMERSNTVASPVNVNNDENMAELPDFDNQPPPLGYELSFEVDETSDPDVEELPSYLTADASSSGPLVGQKESSLEEWSFLSNYQQLNAEVYNTTFDFESLLPPIERPLKPTVPYTYSFQETTFARRLHRLCLERAFRTLTDPEADPACIQRVFRFTFSFSNKKRMLGRFQELLKRRAGESLENWNVPFFHIGGAGTHFPRLDEQGQAVYPPNILSPARAFGPLALPTAETPRDEATMELLLESIGFGGVWFDSHDVESYLRTKGLHLDGNSSFVDIDPSAVDRAPPLLLHSNSSTSSRSSGVSPLSSSPRTSILDTTLQIADPNYPFQELPDPFGPDSLIIYPTFQDKVTTYPAADFQHQQPQSPSRVPDFQDILYHHQRHNSSTQPVTVDVSKLLDRIVEGSACLGRAPGFRRKDIDNALVMAIQEAF